MGIPEPPNLVQVHASLPETQAPMENAHEDDEDDRVLPSGQFVPSDVSVRASRTATSHASSLQTKTELAQTKTKPCARAALAVSHHGRRNGRISDACGLHVHRASVLPGCGP